jgi:hypothetical protein
MLQAVSGSRDVNAVFAEFNVPIVRGLDAQLAVRYDDYSDFGATTNPKVALRWQPLSNLLVRGSWGTGFRAPPLYSLSLPTTNTGEIGGIEDPIRCPVTGALDDCFGIVQNFSGGNPNLQPETSTQWNFGVVWEPAPGLSLGVDYWNIEQEGVIAPLDAENLFRYYDKFSHRVTRGPVDPQYPNLPGPIVAITLVLASVFVPLAFLGGVTGQFYKQFAVTIAAAVIISGFNSLTLSPALAAMLLQPHGARKDALGRWIERIFGRLFAAFNRVFRRFGDAYSAGIGGTIGRAPRLLAIYGVLIVVAFFAFRGVQGGYIPSQDKQYLFAIVQLPEAATIDRTDAVVRRMGEIAMAVPGVKNVVHEPFHRISSTTAN